MRPGEKSKIGIVVVQCVKAYLQSIGMELISIFHKFFENLKSQNSRVRIHCMLIASNTWIVPGTTKISERNKTMKIRVSAGSKPRILIPARNNQAEKKLTNDVERIGVSVNEAATMLSLSVRSVWHLIKGGQIKHVKYGTRCIVSVKSLREFVDGEKTTGLETCNQSGCERIPQ